MNKCQIKHFDKTTQDINLHEDRSSSVGIMNQVQPEILLAVQLGALHARSKGTLQYGVEEIHHTFTDVKDLSVVKCNYVKW